MPRPNTMPQGEACQRLRRQLREAQEQSESMRLDAARLADALQKDGTVKPEIWMDQAGRKWQDASPQPMSRKTFASQPLQPAPPGAEGGHFVAPRRQQNLDCVKPPLTYEAISAAASPQHRLPPPQEVNAKPLRCEAPLSIAELRTHQVQGPERRAGVPNLRVHVGILQFENCGFGAPGLFETSGFRIMLQTGGRAPVRWSDSQPATAQQELKYSKVISSDGRYSASLSCAFNEELSLPMPPGPIPETLCVDVWLESRTFVERLDSFLQMVGLGSNLPEFDHRFLGRIMVSIPPLDVEAVQQNYPIQVSKLCDGPRPKLLSVGMQWACDRPD